MKKSLRKILIIAIAAVCAMSVQISASAVDLGENMNWDAVQELIGQIFPNNTTTEENPDNTTTTEPDNTTQKQEDTSNPVNSSGNGTLTTEGETTTEKPNSNTYYPTVNNNNNNNNNNLLNYPATEPAGDESTTLSFEASLSDIFEDDSAAVIIQTPTEVYTIDGLIVDNGRTDDDGFTWQMGALIAAAVLFVVLLALIAALIIQNAKKKKEDAFESGGSYGDDESSGPVPVEVMTPERIAELLGNAAGRNVSSDYETMSSDETAAAIKAAALMGQLSHSYSDPLLRKYTEEPVMISPNSAFALDADTATVADILKATDNMLNDIGSDNVYAKENANSDTDNKKVDSNGERICPDCGNNVPIDDVFCHNCGTYIG